MKKPVSVKLILFLVTAVIIFNITASRGDIAAAAENITRNQTELSLISKWPNLPTPYAMKDWKQTGLDYTNFVFDENRTGINLPLVKVVPSTGPFSGGYTGDVFSINSYATKADGSVGEAVAQLSAVASGSLLGIDMTKLYGRDWVDMCRVYYSRSPRGDGFISNGPGTDCTDYWYTLYPTFLYNAVSAANPSNHVMEDNVLSTADTWIKALKIINHNWMSEGFSVANMKPFDTGIKIPEGVAGVAYLEYQAYLISKDQKYLDAAFQCLQDAADMKSNPYYEILGSLLPIIAARANAEQGRAYPIDKFINWTLEADSPFRKDWGVINGSWGDYDVYGLEGSRSDSAGYAFAMNSFITGAELAPVARYAPEYSDAIGKYLLALANNARLFFPAALPENMQSNYALAKSMGAAEFIAYEGLRNDGKTTPYGTGDDENAFLCPYASGTIGMFASMIEETNVKGILQIDLLKTDFRSSEAYQTYLYYNPYAESKFVSIDLGTGFYDLYDSTSKSMLLSNATGKQTFNISGKQSVQLVLLPPNAKITYDKKTAFANGIAYDYDYRNGIDIKAAGVLLEKTQILLATGTNTALKVTVLPYKASAAGIAFKSSDKTIASVDEEGVISARTHGNAEISVVLESGETAAVCEVTVLQGIDLAGELTGACSVQNNITTVLGGTDQTSAVASVTKRLNISEYPYLCIEVGNFTEDTCWGLSITNSTGKTCSLFSNAGVAPGSSYQTMLDLKKITGFSSTDDYTINFTIFGPKSMKHLSYDIIYAQLAPYNLDGSKPGVILDEMTDSSGWQADVSQNSGEVDITGFAGTSNRNSSLGANADLENVNGVGRIINNVNTWSDITFEKLYNVNLYPIFKCRIESPSNEKVKYAIKLGRADTGNFQHEFVLQGDIPVGEKPEIEINLKDLTQYSGMTDIGFSFCIIGEAGDTYDLVYAKAVSDSSIPQGDPLRIEADKNKTVMISFGPGSAGIKKQYTMDLTEYPALLGMIKSPEGVDWSVAVKGVSGMEDIGSQYIILKSGDKGSLTATEEGSEFAVNVAEKTGWSGKCTYELVFTMSAVQNQSVSLYRLMKAASVLDHYSLDNDISKSEGVTEANRSLGKGCFSLIIIGIAVVLLMISIGVLKRKRKK